MAEGLKGALPASAVHLCVDMQNLFRRETAWHTPWMDRIIPAVVRLTEPHPDRTIFTRFIPAARPGEGDGTWKGYYERWAEMTLERLDADMTELAPQLSGFAPPATIIDKKVYSPWFQPELDDALRERGADTIVVSGGETDVCVLATVLGAVDRGFRVVIARDALCSSSDATHDALITLYHERFGQQVEVAAVEQIVAALA